MIIGQKKTLKSVPLTQNVKEQILQTSNPIMLQKEGGVLDQLYAIFKNRIEDHPESKDAKYSCYIEEKAMAAFLKFANDVYKARKHEAQGVFVGYYLHNENDSQKKFAVCTHFIQASGKTTNVTCEMSTQDLAKYSEYCDRNHMMIIAHVHSHPGLSAFYSMPDSETLRTLFYASQNVGIVIDNLHNEYLAYKMYNGEKLEEPIYQYNAEECLKEGKLIATLLSNVSHGSNLRTREVVDFSKLRQNTATEEKVTSKIESKKKESTQLQAESVNYLGIKIGSLENKIDNYYSYTKEQLADLPQVLMNILMEQGYITKGSDEPEKEIIHTSTCKETLYNKMSKVLPILLPIIELVLLFVILILELVSMYNMEVK